MPGIPHTTLRGHWHLDKDTVSRWGEVFTLESDWFDLLLVFAGGAIGIAGGTLSAILSGALAIKKTRRNDLLSAYVDWAKVMHIAIDAVSHLWMFDAVEKLKGRAKELATIPSSASGMTREQLVRDSLTAKSAVRAAEARLILLERRPQLREMIVEFSGFPPPDKIAVPEVMAYMAGKRNCVGDLLDRVAGKSSGF